MRTDGHTAKVESVNLGTVREFDYQGRVETTGIFKEPTGEPVEVSATRFGRDEQANLDHHGGPDRVAYLYAAEDLAWWEQQLGRPVPPGSMGENLTTSGLEVTEAVIGEQWRIGGVTFEVAGLRTPCYKLSTAMGMPAFATRFTQARRPGAYLRVVSPGALVAGDLVEVVGVPDHGVTLGLLADAYHRDERLAARLLDAPELSPEWRDWAAKTVAENQA